MRSRISPFLLPATALAASLLLASCGGEGPHEGDGHAHEGETASAPLSSDELKMKLVAADALDGQADQTVHRCSGCRLGMNGKAEHSIEVEGYTLHMCSASCKAAFNKDLSGNLAKLEIPES